MQNVSLAFIEANKSPIRQTSARVTFELIDPNAYTDLTILTSDECLLSSSKQLTNKARRTSYNFATLEPDFFKLDGSFSMVDPEYLDDEVGYISNLICNQRGEFEKPIFLEFVFKEWISSPGLTLTFDTDLNEFADSFRIEVYRDDALIHVKEVTGNLHSIYELEESLDRYTKVRITVSKWCRGNRRARVVEVDFGLLKVFNDRELIKVDLLEELDTINNVIASNELRFTIDNQDRSFNILNPTGIYRFLKERQEVTCEFGVKVDEQRVEMVKMGSFYLDEWQVDEGALTASFTAYDITQMLERYDYESDSSYTTSAYALCVVILNHCRIKKYKIDESLRTIYLNQQSESITCREALQLIAIASLSVVYQDREGYLRIEPLEGIIKRERYICYAGEEAITGVSIPEIDHEAYIKTIDLDNAYSVPQIKLSTSIEQVVVHYKVNQEERTYQLNSTLSRSIQLEGKTATLTNSFIADEETAKKVAFWLLEELKLNAEYTSNWRGNAAFECGDRIFIEDGFKTIFQSRIIKQEFDYSGYLKCTTTTKGSV